MAKFRVAFRDGNSMIVEAPNAQEARRIAGQRYREHKGGSQLELYSVHSAHKVKDSE